MKNRYNKIIYILLFSLTLSKPLMANGHEDILKERIDIILTDYALAIEEIYHEASFEMEELNEKIILLEYDMAHPEIFSKKAFVENYRALKKLKKTKANAEISLEVKNLQLRYKKGIDIIKLLYEKILGLDHHFSGMQTLQNIMLLTNPNSYPEFTKNKDKISLKRNKKFNLNMPKLFESNVYLSATYTLINGFLGDGDRKEKETNMDNIACILDFTVRMYSDLNVILHETEYLKNANQNLKNECEKLFTSYVKVIDYLVPIDKCRQNDDWESVHNLLEAFVNENDVSKQETIQLDLSKNLVNLEFATERVAEFISKYISFIEYGTQYYQKFDNIISTYQNQDVCQSELPHQFTELKFDIKSTIDKFSNTYNMPELQGSRLKDLLFGKPKL